MQTSDPAEVFERLKQLLIPYSRELEILTDTPTHYELGVPVTITIGEAHYQKPFYSTVLLKQQSVFFSFIIYRLFPETLDLPAVIKKQLRKHEAFDFKRLTDEQEAAIAGWLQQGFNIYQNLHNRG